MSFITSLVSEFTVCVCVRACVRACVRVCVRACVHACVRACVCNNNNDRCNTHTDPTPSPQHQTDSLHPPPPPHTHAQGRFGGFPTLLDFHDHHHNKCIGPFYVHIMRINCLCIFAIVSFNFVSFFIFLLPVPVTFSGKPVLHKHESGGENSRVVCSHGLNRQRVSQIKFSLRLVWGFYFISLFFILNIFYLNRERERERARFDLGSLGFYFISLLFILSIFIFLFKKRELSLIWEESSFWSGKHWFRTKICEVL